MIDRNYEDDFSCIKIEQKVYQNRTLLILVKNLKY